MSLPRAAAMAPNAIAAVAPSSAVGNDDVKYGMTMWFKVDVAIDGTSTPLGEWSTCSGIGVDFTSEPVEEGLRHAERRLLPKTVTNTDITLERAISRAESLKLRRWLAKVVEDWMLADDGGAPAPGGYPGVTATIQLFAAPEGMRGSTAFAVAKWDLRNVYPKAWKAPKLDAGSGGIAIETLTLTHGGLLIEEPGTAASRTGRTGEPGLLTLKAKTGAKDELELQYQPSSIRMKKSTSHDDKKSEGSVADPGKVSIDFSVLVEGATAVRTVVTCLYGWLEQNDKIETAADKTRTRNPTELELKVGKDNGKIPTSMWVREVSTEFTRFTRDGSPSRAKLGLVLEQYTGKIKLPPLKPAAKKAMARDDAARLDARLKRVEDMLRIPR